MFDWLERLMKIQSGTVMVRIEYWKMDHMKKPFSEYSVWFSEPRLRLTFKTVEELENWLTKEEEKNEECRD